MAIASLVELNPKPSSGQTNVREFRVDFGDNPAVDGALEPADDLGAFYARFNVKAALPAVNFIGPDGVLDGVTLQDITTSDPDRPRLRDIFALDDFPVPDDPNLLEIEVAEYQSKGVDYTAIRRAADGLELINFNHETGNVRVDSLAFAGLSLGEELKFEVRLDYTGNELDDTVTIALRGGGDTVQASEFTSDYRQAVGDGPVLINLNEVFSTADSTFVDVHRINFQSADGAADVGISDWFDLEGGGRVRAVTATTGNNRNEFQSFLEFDQDGDFDDLIPFAQRTTQATVQIQAAGFDGFDLGSADTFTIPFTVTNNVAEPEIQFDVQSDGVFDVSTSDFFLTADGKFVSGQLLDVLANDTITNGEVTGLSFWSLNFPGVATLGGSAGTSAVAPGFVFHVVATPDEATPFKIVASADLSVFEDLAPGTFVTATVGYAITAISPLGTENVPGFFDPTTSLLEVRVLVPTDEVPIAETDFGTTLVDDDEFAVDLTGNDFNPIDDAPLKVTHIDGRTVDENGRGVTDDGLVYQIEDGLLKIEGDSTGNRFQYLGAGDVEFVDLTYVIEDFQGSNAQGNAVLGVRGVNDTPDVNPFGQQDVLVVSEDGATTINLLANDIDLDATDRLSVTRFGGVDLVEGVANFVAPDGGMVEVTSEGAFTFTPGTDFFSLSDGDRPVFNFDYTAEDTSGASDTGTVEVTVIGLDQPTTAEDDAVSVGEDGSTALSVFNNDTDPDGGIDDAEVQSIAGIDVTGGGTFVIVLTSGGTLRFVSEANLLTYTPGVSANGLAAGETGADSFTYTILSGGVESTATVDIDILGANDAPVAVDEDLLVVGSSSVEIDVLANDFDPDREQPMLQSINFVSRGIASIDDRGTMTPDDDVIVFTPDTDTLGVSSIGYTIVDGSGVVSSARALVTIVPGNSIFGTEGDDAGLVGDGADDTVFALGGSDRIQTLRGNDLVFAGAGDDRVFLRAGNDTANGDAGDDLLVGGVGADKLSGGDGNDELIGGGGVDMIDGGNDADILFGGRGNDIVLGGNGSDVINGELGADDLSGGAGNDEIRGNTGHDTINGDAGDDILFGGPGWDRVNGGAGNDTIYGGRGEDTIDGGLDSDLMFGGRGADSFVLELGSGEDMIGDFEVGADVLQLGSGHSITSFNTVDTDATVGDDSTLVEFADGSSVLLLSVLGVTDTNDLL